MRPHWRSERGSWSPRSALRTYKNTNMGHPPALVVRVPPAAALAITGRLFDGKLRVILRVVNRKRDFSVSQRLGGTAGGEGCLVSWAGAGRHLRRTVPAGATASARRLQTRSGLGQETRLWVVCEESTPRCWPWCVQGRAPALSQPPAGRAGWAAVGCTWLGCNRNTCTPGCAAVQSPAAPHGGSAFVGPQLTPLAARVNRPHPRGSGGASRGSWPLDRGVTPHRHLRGLLQGRGKGLGGRLHHEAVVQSEYFSSGQTAQAKVA
jgi:hypothetical protein